MAGLINNGKLVDAGTVKEMREKLCQKGYGGAVIQYSTEDIKDYMQENKPIELDIEGDNPKKRKRRSVGRPKKTDKVNWASRYKDHKKSLTEKEPKTGLNELDGTEIEEIDDVVNVDSVTYSAGIACNMEPEESLIKLDSDDSTELEFD